MCPTRRQRTSRRRSSHVGLALCAFSAALALVLLTGLPAHGQGSPVATAEAALTRSGVGTDGYVSEREAKKALQAGLTEGRLLQLLEPIVAPCLARDEACKDFEALGNRKARRRKVAEALAGLLGRVGTTRSLSLLDRMDARGWTAATLARRKILDRDFESYRQGISCPVPDGAQVRRARAALDDFVVLRQRGGRLLAESLTAPEKDDLAYFLAAVSDAGSEVGATREGGAPGSNQAPDPSLERLHAQVEAAKKDGDPRRVVLHAEAYLKALGYPGPIRFTNSYAWGGARYSFVMRDLAYAYERLGRHGDAAALLRRANPGGGACGTSVSSRWAKQVRGVIRNEERAGACRAVVAERLLGIDDTAYGSAGPYGTSALTRDRYDLGRLYRGALLTMNRDLPPSVIEAALRTAPPPLREGALRRYRQRGPEDWDRRVGALEGWAAVGGAAALPTLRDAVALGAGDTRRRALRALAELARKPDADPCTARTVGLRSMSSQWRRAIPSLGRSCATKLANPEADRLARFVVQFAGDPDMQTRAEVARTLGALGSPAALPALRTLLRDPAPASGTICTYEGEKRNCRPNQPVREAATEAIERIRNL